MARKVKSLLTLMDIRQKELERLQAHRATLEGQREQTIQMQKKLQMELEREAQIARNAAKEGKLDMLSYLPGYTGINHKRQHEYKQAQERLERQIGELQDIIATIFGELKKLQIAKERIEKAEADKAAKLEQQLMDEMGLQGFRRKDRD